MSGEEWKKYNDALSAYEKHMEEIKPRRENFGYNGYWPSEEQHDAYVRAMREWHNAYFMDKPDKPGYYRANND